VHHLLQSFRHAARALRRSPGFSFSVIASLALGIGATIAVFAVVNAVLLSPLPYADADRLVAMFLREPQNQSSRNPTSPREFRVWRNSRSVDAMTAATPWAPVLTESGEPDQLHGLKASSSLFDLLGVQPMLGRTFHAGVESDIREHVVVLGHGLWMRRFGGDPSIAGRSLRLDGEPYEVIGVMPPRFEFPPFWATEAEFWSPLVFAPEEWDRGSRYLRVFARLRDGSTLAGVQAEMDLIARRIAEDVPEDNAGTSINVEPLQEPVVSDVRPAILLLFAAVGFVLLIACANVANLQLTRATGRRREVAVRLALGAKRSHLAVESLAESVLLAGAGGAIGLLIAEWVLAAFASAAPGTLPAVAPLRLDLRVLAFAAGTSLLAAALSGLTPVWRAIHSRAQEGLAEGGRHSGSARQARLRQGLAVLEIAVAVTLVAGAGLLMRSLWSLQSLDPGFDRSRVLTASVALAGSEYAQPATQPRFLRSLQGQLDSLPEVERAGMANFLPIGGDLWGMRFAVEGQPVASPEQLPRASFRVITPGYLAAMGTRIERGRDFAWQDDADALQVVVVNRTLAARYWPDDDPIGKRLRWGAEGPDEPWLTVIGVAEDVRQWDLADDVRPEVYFPYGQNPLSRAAQFTVALRPAAGATLRFRTLQSIIWSLDPDLPVTEVRTIDAILDESLGGRAFYSTLLTWFAAAGLCLASVGVYGVISFGVSQRLREFGIRMALGARRRDVVLMVMVQGVRIAAAGLAIGLGGALALTRGWR
jgi:predicted permease